MEIKFTTGTTPPGKLADAELRFTDGPLAGLKLIGFAIWERRVGSGRNVTFPARQYSVNGERRTFALLRPITDTTAHDSLRDQILEAFAAYEAATAGDTYYGPELPSYGPEPPPAPPAARRCARCGTVDMETVERPRAGAADLCDRCNTEVARG